MDGIDGRGQKKSAARINGDKRGDSLDSGRGRGRLTEQSGGEPGSLIGFLAGMAAGWPAKSSPLVLVLLWVSAWANSILASSLECMDNKDSSPGGPTRRLAKGPPSQCKFSDH